MTIQEQFWDKVDKRGVDECWEWRGEAYPNGYGRAEFDGRAIGSHRLARILDSGPIPDGLCVCHSCDNPLCCNPSHLWLGTRRENAQDRKQKGRNNTGVVVRKLTKRSVEEIRAKYARGGVTCYQLAEEYGVTPTAIAWHVRKP